jgi:hypothetical protein
MARIEVANIETNIQYAKNTNLDNDIRIENLKQDIKEKLVKIKELERINHDLEINVKSYSSKFRSIFLVILS